MLPNLPAPHIRLSTPGLSFRCIKQMVIYIFIIIIIIVIIINVNYYHGSRTRKLTTAITTTCYDPKPVSTTSHPDKLKTCSKIIIHVGGFQRHSSWFCISHCSLCSFTLCPNPLLTWIVSKSNTHTKPYIFLLKKLIHINTKDIQKLLLFWNSSGTKHIEQINGVLWGIMSSSLVKGCRLHRESYCISH